MLPREFSGAAEYYTESTEDRYAKHDAGDRQLHRREDDRRARRGQHQVGAAAITVFQFDSYLVTAGRTIHKTSSTVTVTLEPQKGTKPSATRSTKLKEE